MAKAELRKPIEILMIEKNKIDGQLTTLKDQYESMHAELQKLRFEQMSYREGKETLQPSNQNKPARRVFDAQIASAQLRIDVIMKSLDQLEKDRVVTTSRVKAIEKSIKELQNA